MFQPFCSLFFIEQQDDEAFSAPSWLFEFCRCWDTDPSARPSFEKVLELLKEASSKV
jgi:hypothetical protein